MKQYTMIKVLAVTLLVGFLNDACAVESDRNAAPDIWCYLVTDMLRSFKQSYKEPRANCGVAGKRLSIASVGFDRGIGTHAPSELVFDLAGKHRKFSSDIGVDDAADSRGSVVFSVLLDGREAFNSGVMKVGQPAKKVSLDVTGVRELRLVVTDAGDGVGGDHADWAGAAIDDVIAAKPVPQFSAAGFFAVSNSPRTVLNFNPGWRFLKADAVGAEKVDYDDSGWEAANLPHSLEILGENASGCRNYQGPAWYRKKFSIWHSEDGIGKGGRCIVYFEGVMGKCKVWVNGKPVAEHFGGYLPIAADITDCVLEKDNVIAVRADNSDDPTYPPGKPQNNLDFTYLGGVYRDVYLIRTSETFVTLPELSTTVAGGGVFVGVKDINGNSADIEVRTEVANRDKSVRKLTVRSVLETAEGKDLLQQETTFDMLAEESRQISQNLDAQGVRLWHPDDPYLHFIRTEVLIDGKVCDSLRTRFGIRIFEMCGKDGLFVNKRFIGTKLSGVNRHQDYHFVGNALPNSGQWRDVKLLREGGSTMIRAAHYPMDPAFYDACDEFGMLVTTANPGWQFFNFKDPVFEQRLYEDTHALVRRDRNHPSMLLWETALNETTDQPDRVLQGMNKAANSEYPFPGFYTVADGDEAKRGSLNFYYHGGFDTSINSQTREYGDGGEVENFYSQNASTRVKREWGERALLGQAIIRARNLDGIYGTPPQRIGATLWCGIDHQRGYHPDPFWGGLLDGARIPRYSFYLFKSQYDPEYKLPGIETGPMVKIAHELTQVSGPDVIIYSNCEEVRLTWLGKVVAVQKPDEGLPRMPHPPFTFSNVFDFAFIKKEWRSRTGRIEMIAEGLIGGKVVAREVKKYAERTTAVSVAVDDAGIGLVADGSDFVPVRATIVDNKGVPKVLAAEYVYFEVEGPAEIIGGPGTHINPAKTEFGTATVLVRAGTTPGVIKVKAFVKGLAAGEAYVASIAPALPLGFDAAYARASRPADNGVAAVIRSGADDAGGDVKQLKAQLRRMQLELTSKEQDLMELRSKVK